MKITRFGREWSCWYEGEIKGVEEDSKTRSVGGG